MNIHKLLGKTAILPALMIFPPITATLYADHHIPLPEVVVRATALDGESRMANEPGPITTLLLTPEDSIMAESLDSTLRQAPGVYSVADDGGRQTRISMRGSGLQNPHGSVGLLLLYNHIPLNRADGSYTTQAIDPNALSSIEVLPGGNAYRYGSSTLGGAIRFNSLTGINHPGRHLHASGGSWNTFGQQLTLGEHFPDQGIDFHTSLSYQSSDGFRENSDRRSITFNGNLGIQHSEHAETRIFLLLSEGKLQIPGGLSLEEARANPRASLGPDPGVEWRRDTNDYIIGTSTVVKRPNALYRLGTFAARNTFYHPSGNPPTNLLLDDTYRTYGLNFNVETSYQFAGLDHELDLGVRTAYTEGKRRGSRPVFSPPFPRSDILTNQRSTQTVFHAAQRTHLTEDTRLHLGSQFIHATRKQTDPNRNFDESYTHWAPRIGLDHSITESIEIYTNFTESYEAPRFGTFTRDTPVNAQRARTGEIGIRGSAMGTDWNLALFHSRIRDRFIFVTPPGQEVAVIDNTNARQQGIELSSITNIGNLLNTSTLDGLTWRNTFTYSDFRFRNDPIHGNNRMPLVPEYRLSSQLAMEWENGFDAAAELEGIFGDRQIDNANTAQLGSYFLVHLSAGYSPTERFRVYARIHNVFNQNYIANYNLREDVSGGAGRIFFPGEPRAVYVGASVAF